MSEPHIVRDVTTANTLVDTHIKTNVSPSQRQKDGYAVDCKLSLVIEHRYMF